MFPKLPSDMKIGSRWVLTAQLHQQKAGKHQQLRPLSLTPKCKLHSSNATFVTPPQTTTHSNPHSKKALLHIVPQMPKMKGMPNNRIELLTFA